MEFMELRTRIWVAKEKPIVSLQAIEPKYMINKYKHLFDIFTRNINGQMQSSKSDCDMVIYLYELHRFCYLSFAFEADNVRWVDELVSDGGRTNLHAE